MEPATSNHAQVCWHVASTGEIEGESGLHAVKSCQSCKRQCIRLILLCYKTFRNGLQVYEDAGRAYVALEEHLRSNSGKGSYFFGSRPSSLDAATFAHLAFHHGAPVSAPELRQKVSRKLHHIQRSGSNCISEIGLDAQL